MLAGTKDGENWGFYFDDQKDSLKKYFELTHEEHNASPRKALRTTAGSRIRA